MLSTQVCLCSLSAPNSFLSFSLSFPSYISGLGHPPVLLSLLKEPRERHSQPEFPEAVLWGTHSPSDDSCPSPASLSLVAAEP